MTESSFSENRAHQLTEHTAVLFSDFQRNFFQRFAITMKLKIFAGNFFQDFFRKLKKSKIQESGCME
jgi:hypothetical protein